MPSYAVLTCALHEHAYINAFISHYKNLGFNSIYIVCDKFQPKYESYIIPHQDLKIHFIHMNYTLQQINSFDTLQLEYYRKIIPSINSDWIFLCDIDEFLYLPCNHIQNFMNPLLSQYNDLAQVSFPWMMVDSLKDDYIHMFDQLQNHKWFTNHHVKSLFQKKSLVYKNNKLSLSTHATTVNGRTYLQNGFVPPFQLNSMYQNRFSVDFYKKHAFIIHFHTRSFKNNMIKILTNKYSGKSDQNQKRKLLALIKNNSYDYKNLTKFALISSHQTKEIPHFDLVGLNHNILPNNIQYNHDLFNQLIEYYNLSEKYFEKIWENPEITISPSSTLYTKNENIKIENITNQDS